MAKKLSKILWYGADKDASGKPIIPPLSPSIEKHLEGLNEGEIYIHNDDEYPALYIRTNKDKIVAIGGAEALMKYFLRKDQPDTAREVITFEKGLNVGEFVSGASGASIFKDLTTGQTIMELDKLYVRMKAFFETLTIVEAQTISGKQIISPAGSVRCTNVEEYDDYYRCYFLNEQDGEKIENKFIVGDQAYSQMFNAKTGTTNKISNRYYWRLVMGVGENYIDLSKTDCDTDSDAPMVGDILNQRGHRYPENSERMNFIETSTVDGFSPSITLFHGVNSWSLDSKAYVQFGVDKTTNKAFMHVYGDMYVGDRNQTAYIRYTQEDGLEICGKLAVGTKLGDKDLQELIDSATPEGYQEFVEQVTKELGSLQSQIDGAIESFFYQYEPSLENYPASEWIEEGTEEEHLNDTFTNLVDGRSWRWSLDGIYKWVEITDTATTKALALAGKAKDTAEGKRRVFVVTDEHPTPYPPYDKGDLWSRGSDYPLLICVVPKESGVYAEGDFDYADNNAKLKEEMQTLVTDTKSELNNSIGQAKEEAVKNANSYTDEGKKALQASIDAMEKSKANITEVYTQAEADKKISESEERALKAAEEEADAAIAYYDTIVKAYADGVATEEELALIAGAKAALDAAKEYAEEQAKAAREEIENSYLFQALQDAQSTEIENGLILTSLIQLRDTQSNIMSGINGLINASKGDKSIATWWGGGMYDLIDYYTWDGSQWVVKSGITAPSNIPSGLIRMDGTGYLAKGKFWWDNDGKIYADPTALFLSFDVENEGASLSATILDIRDKQTEFANMWSLQTDSNGTKYLYSKYPLVSQGGVTMYAGTSGIDVEGIYDGLPIDGSTIYWENGVLKAQGGGVADSVAWADITGKPSFATVATSGSYNDLLNKPTLLSSFTNDLGFVTSSDIPSTYAWSAITSKPTTLSGYGITDGNTWMRRLDTRSVNSSPYGSTYTDRVSWHLKYNDTIGITTEGTYSGLLLLSPWTTSGGGSEHQLAFGTNGSIYHRYGASSWSAWNKIITNTSLTSALSGYLPLSGGTIKNGTASPLAIDTTGTEANLRIRINGSGKALFGYKTGVGTWMRDSSARSVVIGDDGVLKYGTDSSLNTVYHSGNLTKLSQLTNDSGFITSSASISGNAGSATKLATARTIWGQSFDGTGNVTGGLTDVSSIQTTGAAPIYLYRDSSKNGHYITCDHNGFGISKCEGQVWKAMCLNINYDTNNVAIGQVANSYKFHVNGSLNATTIYQNGSSLNSLLGTKLNSSSYTAADVLAKLKTVDGSGSGLDADTLDGLHNYGLHSYIFNYYENKILASDTDLNNVTGGVWGTLNNTSYTNAPFQNFGLICMSLNSSYVGQLVLPYYQSNIQYRSQYYANGRVWSEWKTLAFTTDNVASATKLQTARTIWGQSFDGTGNVSGNLHLSNNAITDLSSNRILLCDGPNLYFGTVDAVVYNTFITGKSIALRYGSSAAVGFLMNSSGNVGIGTTSPEQKLHVYGISKFESTSNIPVLVKSTNSVESSIAYYGKDNYRWVVGQGTANISNAFGIWSDTLNANAITILSSGNVGIGLTAPKYKLHVNGGDIRVDGWIRTYGDNGWYSEKYYGGWYMTDTTYVRSFTNKSVWIGNSLYIGTDAGAGTGLALYGSSNPDTYGIHMSKTASYGTHGSVTSDWATYLCMSGATSRGFIFRQSGSNVASISGTGNMLLNGGLTMYSDIRKKTKLKDVELSLKEIADAPLIEHYYNSDDKKTTHVGSIAQYWAGLNDWFCKLDNEGYYTMEIQNAALASSISIARELVRYESETDKQIRALKSRVRELEEEVKRLRA